MPKPIPQAESFIKTLRVKDVYRTGYETFADVTSRLPKDIEQVCNAKRPQSALGYRPPKNSKPDWPSNRLGSDGPRSPVLGVHSKPAHF